MAKPKIINVKGTDIVLFNQGGEDYVSITDIARYKNASEPKDVVKNWMRSRSTIEFLGLWERIHNPNFKGVDFDPFLYAAGSNSFVLSPSKWIEICSMWRCLVKQPSNGKTETPLQKEIYVMLQQLNNWWYCQTWKVSMPC